MRYHKTTPPNVVTVPPVDEPVSVEDVKDNSRIVDNAEEDKLIRTQLIPEAREYVEELAKRSLMTQTRVQYYDRMPREIYFRYSPVQSITSITYRDTSNVSQTLAATEYELDSNSIPAHIVPAFNKTWPSTACVPNAVAVTCVCGYGSNPGKVPIIYRRAIIYLAGYSFDNNIPINCVDSDVIAKLEQILAIEGRTVEYA